MRDEKYRLADLLLNSQQFFPQDDPGLLVERAERLVHQEDVRVLDEGLGDRRPLLHPAG